MAELNAIADSRPVVTGAIGTIAGWGGALITYLDDANRVLAFFGTLAGTVAAVYTALIVIRRYHRGLRREKIEKRTNTKE